MQFKVELPVIYSNAMHKIALAPCSCILRAKSVMLSMLRGDYMGLKVNRQTNLEKLFDQFAVIEPEKTEKNKEKADKSQKTESKKEDKK